MCNCKNKNGVKRLNNLHSRDHVLVAEDVFRRIISKKEFTLIRSQEAKKSMLKEVLTTEQFSAYEKYFLTQAKINSEKAIVVPQKKKIIAEEPVMLDKAIE